MAITAWPHDVQVPSLLLCAICNEHREPHEVSAGFCDANGQQAFACNGHFLFGHQFILGWASFVSQQRKDTSEKTENQIFAGADNGRMLY